MDFEFVKWLYYADPGTRILAGALAAMFAFALVTRILAACGYWARWGTFRLSFHRVESKTDIVNLKGGLFARLAKELAARGESNPERLDAYKLAELDATRIRPGLFRANVTGRLADALMWGFMAAAFFCAFASGGEDAGYFLVGAAGLFMLLLIFAAVFDYKAARERYILRVGDALERGVGRLYLTRSSSGVLRQAADELSAALAKGAEQSAAAFTEGNKENAALLKNALDGHEREVAKIFGEQAAQTNALREAALRLSARSELFEENAELIKANQKALADTLAAFEVALQNITTEMGAAFGKIVEYQARQALQRAESDAK